MQIALKNSYFSQIIRTEVVKGFQAASVQGKDRAISRAMDWMDVIAECFGVGAKRNALGHLFDMVQAEKANQAEQLTFAEKADNANKAKAAFGELQKLAYPNFAFIPIITAAHKTSFLVLDRTNPEFHIEIPLYFEFFDTEQAVTQWDQIKDGFAPEQVTEAIYVLNKLCNEKNTCDKVRHFTELTRLARPEHQKKFGIQVTSSLDQADLLFSFKDQLLSKEVMSCPTSQVEDVTISLMQFRGRVKAGREETGIAHRSARMLLAVGRMEGYCFTADTRAAAAKIISGMFVADVTDAQIERHCDDLVKLDPRFKGYRFIFNPKSESLSKDEQVTADRAAKKIQCRARKFLATGTKEWVGAMINAVKVNGRVEGYIVPQSDGKKKWVALPGPVPEDAPPVKGGSKILSHQNKDYVGLTYQKPAITNRGRVHDPSKPPPAFNTFSRKILDFIFTKKLDCIIPQYRINETQFISQNVGPTDLRKQSTSGEFKFSLAAFARLAGQLDQLHHANIVHRDIKPGNMGIVDGHVRLFDLNTMGEMGQFEDGTIVGTKAYLHKDLRGGLYNISDGKKLGVQVDRYCFLSSMISTLFKGNLPPDGVYSQSMITQ